jgi:hypothetical protein
MRHLRWPLAFSRSKNPSPLIEPSSAKKQALNPFAIR